MEETILYDFFDESLTYGFRVLSISVVDYAVVHFNNIFSNKLLIKVTAKI